MAKHNTIKDMLKPRKQRTFTGKKYKTRKKYRGQGR
jgi:hypothetical protein